MVKKRVQSCSLVSVLVLMVTVIFPGASAAQTTQVVGGTPVPYSQYPYYVDVSGCGGTVAAPGWVLTAAHCVEGRAIQVSRPGTMGAYTPVSVYIHPLWNGDEFWDGHDIALLVMPSGSAAITTHAIQIGSPWDAGAYAPGVEATLIGTGLTSPDGAFPDSLMVAEMPLRSDAYMHDVFQHLFGLVDPWKDALMIGAGNASETACSGDSGGPLFVHVNATPVQVGIVSAGTPDCSAAAMYTELAGPTLAWAAHLAPAIMSNWPVCYDRYGQPGMPSATYTYQPWQSNDGGYFGAITCQMAPPPPPQDPPPPPPPTVDFTGMGSGTKPTTAMTNATSAANRQASNAGYTSCVGVDSSVEYDSEFKRYDATVTVGCTQ